MKHYPGQFSSIREDHAYSLKLLRYSSVVEQETITGLQAFQSALELISPHRFLLFSTCRVSEFTLIS